MGRQITPADLSLQLSRLEAVFGPPKDRTDGQKIMLAREWFEALRGYGLNTVTAAIDKLVRSWRFGWQGALAEASSLCMTDDDEWREALGMVRRDRDRSHRAEAPDTPPTPEQIERVVAKVAALKARLARADREMMAPIHRAASPRKSNREGASPEFLALVGED